MKYPRFECLGNEYPLALEAHYERILQRVDELWESPEITDYFSDLIIDKRGGRKGFSQEVLNDILCLREFRESESLRAAERAEYAAYELQQLGYGLTNSEFFKALEIGSQELIDLYVRANFNIHIVDEWGATPMLNALKRGHTITAGILLNAGCDVNAKDRLGLAPILVACGKPAIGFRTLTEGLIKKGADVNVRDPLGNTPLILAISGRMFDIAEMLLERGADVSATNRKGQGPFSLLQPPDIPEHRHLLDLMEKSIATKASKGVAQQP